MIVITKRGSVEGIIAKRDRGHPVGSWGRGGWRRQEWRMLIRRRRAGAPGIQGHAARRACAAAA